MRSGRAGGSHYPPGDITVNSSIVRISGRGAGRRRGPARRSAFAAGAHAVRVEDPRDVRDALREALAHDGPALVDVVTDPNALSIPPHITGRQLAGFATTSKLVLNGGVGRIIQPARSNLRNIPRP